MSTEALKAKELGNRAYNKRDFAVAHVFYDAAIRLSPREMVFYSNKSATFFEEGKYDDCIATCETALDVGSEDKNLVEKVMTRIAKARAAQGKESEAFTWVQRASLMNDGPKIDKDVPSLTIKPISAERRPLSTVYVSKLIPLVMDVDKAGVRTRNLALSSPIMSACFDKFMEPLKVVVRDHVVVNICGRGSDPLVTKPVYDKKWAAFSWITPFIYQLSIDGAPPDCRAPKWSFEMLPRTTNRLNFFCLWIPIWVHDPLDSRVLPFIRRQLPNLQKLFGPIDFFLELPPNPPEPKLFKTAVLVVRRFPDLVKLFKTKRFSAPDFEFKFVQPPNGGVNFASNFTTFLKKTTVRMPETHKMIVKIPLLNARFPAADLVKALYTVFPNLRTLELCVKLETEDIVAYDFDGLVYDYLFLKKEMKKMPPQLAVKFSIEESVEYVDEDAAEESYDFEMPLHFTMLTPFNQNPYKPISRGIVSKNGYDPVCHDNKFFTYEVVFEMFDVLPHEL